jgi:hypothetical protein
MNKPDFQAWAERSAGKSLLTIDGIERLIRDAYTKGALAGFEEAAVVAETAEIPFPIDTWIESTKKEMTAHTARAIAAFIRARATKVQP